MKRQRAKYHTQWLIIKDKGTAGLTLVEVMMASVILGGAILLAVQVFSSGMTVYDTASAITNAERSIHICLDDIVAKLWECNPSYVWVQSFTDANFATPQEAIIFLWARDSRGVFQITSGGQPNWQSVCVIAPYAYTTGNGTVMKQLCRYEKTGIPSAYYGSSFQMTVTVTPTQIQLPNGVTFNRNQGQVLINDLDDFSVTGTYPLSIAIRTSVKLPNTSIPITLNTELAGRNKN